MKKLNYFLITATLFIISSCGNNEQKEEAKIAKEPPREQFIAQIKKLETEMHKSLEINNVTADLAIKAYSDYVLFFPNDSVAPDYLFKAGEIATATKQYPQALIYYQQITSKYPNFKYITESLYLQAFLLDNYLNDDAKAKIIYEDVIKKYPTSSFSNDAQSAINNLGKSDEELIKEFKKKNKVK